MNRFIFTLLFFSLTIQLFGQEEVSQTFKDRRVINSQSVESLERRKLDFRVTHRFGDISPGWSIEESWQSLFGIENASDVLIGLEYGVTDDFDIGFFRTSGAGPLRKLLHGTAKYRILHQTKDGKLPLSLAVSGMATYSTMRKSEDPEALSSFPKDAHRWVFFGQVIAARKFSPYFSAQLSFGFMHRNLVPADDNNQLFNAGLAMRVQITKVLGIVLDGAFPISDLRSTSNGFYPPIGIGVEFETGGHVFQINFTNARGIMETDYIPYTNSNWQDGEFRLGFTISRMFNI